MLDFEAALATAQAQCGVIPTSAVKPIVDACRAENLDFLALANAAANAGNLAIPLVKQLTQCVKRVDAEASRYVHWGRPVRTPLIPAWYYSCAKRLPKRTNASSA